MLWSLSTAPICFLVGFYSYVDPHKSQCWPPTDQWSNRSLLLSIVPNSGSLTKQIKIKTNFLLSKRFGKRINVFLSCIRFFFVYFIYEPTQSTLIKEWIINPYASFLNFNFLLNLKENSTGRLILCTFFYWLLNWVFKEKYIFDF